MAARLELQCAAAIKPADSLRADRSGDRESGGLAFKSENDFGRGSRLARGRLRHRSAYCRQLGTGDREGKAMKEDGRRQTADRRPQKAFGFLRLCRRTVRKGFAFPAVAVFIFGKA